jgi:hypothetical protein
MPEKTQLDIIKTTIPDVLMKQLVHEAPVVRREALLAMSSLCMNGVVNLLQPRFEVVSRPSKGSLIFLSCFRMKIHK